MSLRPFAREPQTNIGSSCRDSVPPTGEFRVSFHVRIRKMNRGLAGSISPSVIWVKPTWHESAFTAGVNAGRHSRSPSHSLLRTGDYRHRDRTAVRPRREITGWVFRTPSAWYPADIRAKFRRIANRFQLVVATPPRMRRAAAIMKIRQSAGPTVPSTRTDTFNASRPNISTQLVPLRTGRPTPQFRGLQGNVLMNPLSTEAFTSGSFTYNGWTSVPDSDALQGRYRPTKSPAAVSTRSARAFSPKHYNRCNCVPN